MYSRWVTKEMRKPVISLDGMEIHRFGNLNGAVAMQGNTSAQILLETFIPKILRRNGVNKNVVQITIQYLYVQERIQYLHVFNGI
jgi:hypothetical protein